MLTDAATIPSGSSLSFDACIVGAGPAGITVADELRRAGWSVCLLESGGEREEWRSQALAAGETAGPRPYFRLRLARVRAAGGSSWRWHESEGPWSLDGGLRCRPLDPLDFAPRPYLPGSGWPFGPGELAPWYPAAHERCGLGSEVYDSGAWAARGEGPGPVLLPGGPLATTVCLFAPRATFIDRAGELARAGDVTLVLHATVLELAARADGSGVEAVRVAGPAGNAFAVRARSFVLAAGGIDTPRLLLASPLGRPGGVANRFDQVGRNFLEHLHVEAGRFTPAGGRGFAPFAFYRRHERDGQPLLGAFRVEDERQAEEGLSNAIIELRPRPLALSHPAVRSAAELAWMAVHQGRPSPGTGAHLANVLRAPHRVATATALRLAGRRYREPAVASLVYTAEQAPNGASRVTLSTRRDRFGVPRARVEWRLRPLDLESLARTEALAARAFEDAGLGRVEPSWGRARPDPPVHGCRHQVGTTRMSLRPEDGVVDPDCRVHGLENLYVAGSSVMPTAGAVTVTLTTVALALRLADHLRRTVSA